MFCSVSSKVYAAPSRQRLAPAALLLAILFAGAFSMPALARAQKLAPAQAEPLALYAASGRSVPAAHAEDRASGAHSLLSQLLLAPQFLAQQAVKLQPLEPAPLALSRSALPPNPSAPYDLEALSKTVSPGFREASAPASPAPKTSAPKTSAPKTSAPKTSAPKASAPKASAPKSIGTLLEETLLLSPTARREALGLYAAPPRLYARGTPPQERLWAAALRYKRTGKADILDEGETRILTYGKKQPTIETSLLHFSLFELAPNEFVNGQVIMGGTNEYWDVLTATTGTASHFTQVVSVKPKECGIRTNMAIPTNQGRLYQVALVSTECDAEAGELPGPDSYERHVRWWYPDGTVNGQAASEGFSHPVAPPDFGAFDTQRREAFGLEGFPPDPEALPLAEREEETAGLPYLDGRHTYTDFDIDIDRRFPCRPVMVADDGERTYVRFDKTLPLCGERFPPYQEGERGQPQLLNYNVFDGSTYLIEGTPAKFFFMYRAEGGRERRLEVTNERIMRALRRRR